MDIYLGSDHRGFRLKEKVKAWLSLWGYEFKDMGAFKLDPFDDYTVYAQKVAKAVGKNKNSKGILLCGSGVGVNVVANKFDGVRASVGKSSSQVEAGRKHDDMNILVIAADFTGEKQVKEMLRVFLETEFDQESRHKKRLEDISRIEKNN